MIIIIMAGGFGKRMESDLPKVLHNVRSKNNPENYDPMLIHIIKTAIELNPNKIFIIVGQYKDIIINTVKKYINSNFINDLELIEYIEQKNPSGTGDAIKCTLPRLSDFINEYALILSGDVPLISFNTLNNMIGNTNKILITELDQPFGCGRILCDDSENILDIVEEKDCNEIQKKIKFVNCGIYNIAIKNLINLIPQINNNNKANEYYLTDIIKLMINNDIYISKYILPKKFQYEIKNINTKKDLEELNNFINNL